MPSDKITIKCPRCKWKPAKRSQWQCSCEKVWNTFDTVGECPACKKKWKETQCPSCNEWSAHDDWYIIPVDFDSLLNNATKKTIKTKGNRKPNAYYLPEPDLSVQLKRMVTAWCEDRKMLFSTHPDTEHRWIEIFLNEPEQLIAIELGMKQLADGLGLSEETPLYNLGVSGFTSLVAVLSLRKGYRVAEYAFLKEGHIIDRYTIKKRNRSALQLFNKVNTKDDKMDREVE